MFRFPNVLGYGRRAPAVDLTIAHPGVDDGESITRKLDDDQRFVSILTAKEIILKGILGYNLNVMMDYLTNRGYSAPVLQVAALCGEKSAIGRLAHDLRRPRIVDFAGRGVEDAKKGGG